MTQTFKTIEELAQLPTKPGHFYVNQSIRSHQAGGWGDFSRLAECMTLGEAQQIALHADGDDGNKAYGVVDDKQEQFLLSTGPHFVDPRIAGPIFYRASEIGGHKDDRRVITDVVIDLPYQFVEAMYPKRQLQTKSVVMTSKAVDDKLAVGNHYHTHERHEVFVARGPERTLFTMSYSLPGTELIGTFEMWYGDACYIPPGVVHAFVPHVAGAELLGHSNLPFNAEHDVSCKIA